MSLRDLVGNPPPYHHRSTSCVVQRFVDALPEAEREAFVELLLDPDWATNALRIAASREYPDLRVPSTTVIQRHRHAECERCDLIPEPVFQ